MGLETVLTDIQKRGDEAVEAIRSEGKAEAERLLREAQAKKKALLESSLTEAHKTAERLRVQEISRVEMENRRAVLVMQRDILDLALEKARETLAALPADKDRDLLRRILDKNGTLAPVVISSKRQEATVKALVPSLKYGGSIEGLGGIILQTVNGSIRYDFRYETLLEQAAQTSMKEVAGILFQS
jgi:V/A-type H+/Na+-transporting ATPase subunit E